MKPAFFFIFYILLFVYQVLCCSLVPHPLSKFDKTEYVFIGEVIGYTEPTEFKRNNQIPQRDPIWQHPDYKQASGLIVKIKESINLPKTPKTFFEVFPFNLDSGCTTLGIQKYQLKKDFPINSEILVIASEAVNFPHVLENNNFRLEKRFARSQVTALNFDKNNKQLTDINSIFDYSKLDKNFNVSEEYYLFDFEARKDLLRLQLSKTQQEKEIVLNRLLQNPTRSINFLKLFESNVKDQQEILRFYEKRLRFENDFYSKLFEKEGMSQERIQEYFSEEEIQRGLNDAREKLQKNKNSKRKNKTK